MSWQPAAVDELTRQLDRLFGCGIGAAVRLDAEAMLRKALPLIEVTPGMLVSGASVRVPPFASRAEAVGTIFDAMKAHCAKEKSP
jgi:hypothetical protein